MLVTDSVAPPRRVALVLSGAGMFGAWQAGAWAALAEHVRPDLVVGASAGALNGYAIASGVDPGDLCRMWLDPKFTRLGDLSSNIERLMRHYQPRTQFAVTVTDLLRLKALVFRDGEITARHLAASCALPFLLPQVRIEGRWYSDGGLLNPLPVWAAVDLGATHIVGLHALREDNFPWWFRPVMKCFRAVAGHHPTVLDGVTVQVLQPSRRLGGFVASARWERDRIEQWIALGQADARAALAAEGHTKKTFPF
jgi:predicted acylesterase/phospholipase RssA